MVLIAKSAKGVDVSPPMSERTDQPGSASGEKIFCHVVQRRCFNIGYSAEWVVQCPPDAQNFHHLWVGVGVMFNFESISLPMRWLRFACAEIERSL